MSDALSLLRNFVKAKRDFHEEDDKIIFGDVYYPKNVKTTYLIYGFVTKQQTYSVFILLTGSILMIFKF